MNMDSRIAILFGCLVLAAGRIINIEKTSLTLIDDSQELDAATNDILQVFLENADVTSGGVDNDLLPNCTKNGRCEFCQKKLNYRACFIATSGKDSFDLQITVNGKEIFKTTVKVPHSPEECKKKIPVLKMLSDFCVQVKDVDLKNQSGCVTISFKLGFKKYTVDLGCFKIPTLQENRGREIDDRSELKFLPEGEN